MFEATFDGDDTVAKPVEKKQLQGLPYLNPNSLFIVGIGIRPKVKEFVQEVEFSFYPPYGDSEHLLKVYVLQWPDNNPIEWIVLSVPKEDQPRIELIAKKYGLKLQPGSPRCLTVEGGIAPMIVTATDNAKLPQIEGISIDTFPMDANNVTTLEFLTNR